MQAADTFVAAGVAAAIELSIMQPLDVVKTRLQASTQARLSTQTATTLTALRETRQLGGIAGLWRGFGPGLMIVVPRRGLKFAINEALLSCLSIPGGALLAGAGAGACEALVITPLEVVKVQMHTNVGPGPASMLTIAARLWRTGRFAAFYTGVSATVAKHSAHSMVYFGAFRSLQHWARAALQSHVRGDAMAGFAAGVAAGTVNNPFDVLKSRAQVSAHLPGCASFLVADFAQVVRTGGARALFAGWTAKVLRLGPGSAVIFATYHCVLERLARSRGRSG